MTSRGSSSHAPQATRSRVAVHDHAVCVYDSERDALTSLAAFLQEGLVNQEVTTFVHAYKSAATAKRAVAEQVPDATSHQRAQDLFLAHHKDAFELDGSINHEHAGAIVTALAREARQRGRAGSRVFVDASKEYLDAGRTDEWFGFESALGPRLDAEVSLVCAYDARHLRDLDVLARVLATHAYRYASPEIRVV